MSLIEKLDELRDNAVKYFDAIKEDGEDREKMFWNGYLHALDIVERELKWIETF